MPKINQEEYEVLRNYYLRGVRWISKNKNGNLVVSKIRPDKLESKWLPQCPDEDWSELRNSEIYLFLFIQWEDEEPYSIAELIEEYESSQMTYFDRKLISEYECLTKESEETEVKKDIEWLKKRFDEVVEFRKQLNPSTSWGLGSNAVLKCIKEDFKNLINKLDEPEVLSQEWISENVEYAYFDMLDGSGRLSSATAIIKPKKLKNLLVPKQEVNIDVILDDLKEYVKEQQSLSINVGMAHTPAGNDTHYRQYDFVLECIGEYEPSEDLKELLVPKQELPVIPKFVAYVIEAYKSNSRLTNLLADLAFHGELAEFVEHEDEDEVFEWARSNRKATDEILARAWLDGFTVEEEQKFYVINKQGAFALRKDTGGVANSRYTKKEVERLGELQYYQLTEQEIKDYDPRYWPFAVKVEELGE